MENRFANLPVHSAQYAVQAIDAVLADAITSKASDIHLQPRADGWEVLYRIDGVLAPVGALARHSDCDPVTRLMVLAGLPTYRDTQPMEGRLNWTSSTVATENDGDVSMRLGVFPSVHGPRAVVRLLRRNDQFDSIESLGLPDRVREQLITMSERTSGAVLLAGPAGSGKTTTMYAMLRRIAGMRPRRSVVTIEDPVESLIDSISQSEINRGGGMTLASALRSAVRQDSEVLLVSEIRDPETAQAVMQASLTGHLIFSSIHAGDIPAALRRLVQFGVPPHAIRSGIGAVVCQRLLRRLCSSCHGNGCDACSDTGYHGRLPIAGALTLDGIDPIGDALADSLERGDSLGAMRQCMVDAAASSGMDDLRSCAESYVQQGWTDEKEVYRVLGG
ncbi:GspE/PulE family protein [Stieleria varia]|uniref:Type II secretion system protein E n=1 Tax=Stieleria varia TaxID=2528005 RepID=A0A5C6A3G6_9BACT|nr:ATPase, T2SS/T4P/T4SS family [Stieleria varia]TWT93920.1 Type II secretion system protein E [Stieleria varia]